MEFWQYDWFDWMDIPIVVKVIVFIMNGLAFVGWIWLFHTLYKWITKTTKKGKAKMPIGTVLVSTKRCDLLTLPPDGYVTVRRMTYGEELERTGMATKFKMGSTGPGEVSKDNFQGELDINTKDVALWDFANLI